MKSVDSGSRRQSGNYEAPDVAAPTDRRDEAVDRYERDLAERLGLLLAAEFRRRLAERQLKERRDG